MSLHRARCVLYQGNGISPDSPRRRSGYPRRRSIGLILLQLAVAAEGLVTVSEPVQAKWALTKELGAERTVLPEELPADVLGVVVEAAGAKAAIE